MAFCSKCGAPLTEGAQFCPSCGAGQVAAPTAAPQPMYENAEKADAEKNKIVSLLSYLGVLIFVPMLTRKDSPFTQFHVRQGFPLFCISVITTILNIISSIFTVTKTEYVWGVPIEYEGRSTILSILVTVLGIFTAVMAIIGIINCCRGEKKKLPIIGEIDVLKMFGK